MSFDELKSTCETLRALLREATGRELISAISVDEPTKPQDELHFIKLVSWCYVFLFEVAQPAARHILSLLRTSNPSVHRTVGEIFETVNRLRTVRVHNLSPQSNRDDHIRRQAFIWLVQNGGGNPIDWPVCCRSLCVQVRSAIEHLIAKWLDLVASEDASSAVEDLLSAIDREWPPHAFDRILEAAASDIGLKGLDCVKYRESRLKYWRELVGYFERREEAEAAIRSAIRCELEHLFESAAARSRQSGHATAER